VIKTDRERRLGMVSLSGGPNLIRRTERGIDGPRSGRYSTMTVLSASCLFAVVCMCVQPELTVFTVSRLTCVSLYIEANKMCRCMLAITLTNLDRF